MNHSAKSRWEEARDAIRHRAETKNFARIAKKYLAKG